MTRTERSCRNRVSRGCRLKTSIARKKPANSQDAASHQTILKTMVTTNAKSGPSLGVGSDGKTPAASSMMVKPPKEASWQRKRATGFFAKSEPRHEKACDKKDAGESQRDRGLRDKADKLRGHARLILPSRTPNMRCAGSKEASPQPGCIRSAADMQ